MHTKEFLILADNFSGRLDRSPNYLKNWLAHHALPVDSTLWKLSESTYCLNLQSLKDTFGKPRERTKLMTPKEKSFD